MNLDYRELYDISPEISEKLAVWPGDTPFSRDWKVNFDAGRNYRLSTIQGTVHLGAHADAPNHYQEKGLGADKLSLASYFGACQVIHLNLPRVTRVVPDMIGELTSPRVLFRTDSFPDPQNWNEDFCSLSPELVRFLHQHGVQLVGIDTPSVDLFSDSKLLTHQALAETGMSVLEGLTLKDVSSGTYFLMALPLKIKNGDASPVRAVLVR